MVVIRSFTAIPLRAVILGRTKHIPAWERTGLFLIEGKRMLSPFGLLCSLLLVMAGPLPHANAATVDEMADTLQYSKLTSLAVESSETNPDSSLYYLDIAENLPGLSQEQHAQLIRLRADAYYYKYDFRSAAKYYLDASVLEREVHGEFSLHYAERMGDVGFCFYRLTDYPRAVEYFRAALRIVRVIDNKEETATNLNNIGMIYNTWGLYDSSIYYHSAALEIDKVAGDPYYISVDYNNIGKIYEAWGKYGLALEYYQESLKYARESGREMSIAIRLNNIGMVYRTLQDYPSALKYLEEALEIDERLDNRYRIAVRYHNMGQVYDAMGDRDKAMEFYNLALARFRDLSHLEGQAYVYTSMGEHYAAGGLYASAEMYFLKSLRIADSMQLAKSVMANYELLAETYEKKGDYLKALESFKALAAARDSLFTENEQKLMTEFQTKYETEKKEQEIALLSKEKEISRLKLRKANIQLYAMIAAVVLLTAIVLLVIGRYRFKQRVNMLLKDQNDRLETLNATKDKFFAIISHDLRNPMAGIHNIARSASENFERLAAGDLKRMLDSLRDSTQHVHELMQNLLMWAHSQNKSARYEPQPLLIDELVRRSIELNRVRADEKKIHMSFTGNGVDTVYADENMIRTILRNLITNSVKFTPEGGRVEVRTEKVNRQMAVSVIDTGIGMTEDDLARLFRIDQDVKSIGKQEEKGSGLGLILCKEFVEKNGGSITVESEPGRGSTFTFTLPLHADSKEESI